MPTIRKIDHIVYTVPDLDKAIHGFEQKLGIKPLFGGYHTTQGTKNALIKLNQGCYLELLAADDDNHSVVPPRWMGVDVLTQAQITRWAIKSGTLENDRLILQSHQSSMGKITGGSRNTTKGSILKWELIMPLPTPEVEIAPFMVDWGQSKTHPTDDLPDMGCELIELYATHPAPAIMTDLLDQLSCKLRIEKAEKTSIKAILKSPNGIVEI